MSSVHSDKDDSIERNADCAETPGRKPGVSFSIPRPTLQPYDRSDEALRVILLHLHARVAVTIDGVVNDEDVECLHDLRVACRRARSALLQLKGVLPKKPVDHLVSEIRWLGEITNPCRDLDVFLLELDSYRSELGDGGTGLDTFHMSLRDDRAEAHRRVQRALRSPRFSDMVNAWELLTKPDPDEAVGPKAHRSISELAGKKILKAFGKTVGHGTMLSDPPLPEDLHSLRIRAKKLRYLLEFFGGLYSAQTVTRLIKELKQLQNVLGRFNDAAVQQNRITSFTAGWTAHGADSASAMQRLTEVLATRQEEHSRAFKKRFEVFANSNRRELYRTTFGVDNKPSGD